MARRRSPSAAELAALVDASWPKLDADAFESEESLVPRLLAEAPLAGELGERATAEAARLIGAARARAGEHSLLDAFLGAFGLTDAEGVALMCLAEALLRVPDAATADALIADKVAHGAWEEHLGRSHSLLVNAATYGLMLTGRIVELGEDSGSEPLGLLRRVAARGGEPLVRAALVSAMRILAGEFVMGRTIEEALSRARNAPAGARFSFDMLGEGARDRASAERYAAAYEHAIAALGDGHVGETAEGNGISVKLSALHPRYDVAHAELVHAELYPRLLALCEGAATRGLALTVDAEEADRLELSLSLFRRLAGEPGLGSWEGLGLAVQAYGKRARAVVAWTGELARAGGRRFGVRLVKGAYWDSEIKRAQERGLPGFPVFTRKAATDLSYLVCARDMFRAGSALFPQFATHNAHTIAAVMALAGPRRDFEFQRLYGMGERVHAAAHELVASMPATRVYAPVGGHRDLLAYLVRRLLENGANTSFVNRFLDAEAPPELLARDPATALAALRPFPHPAIRAPSALYGEERENSSGLDLADRRVLARIAAACDAEAGRVRGGAAGKGASIESRNPARPDDVLGVLAEPGGEEIASALAAAAAAQPAWDRLGGERRAGLLEAVAARLEADKLPLMALIIREGGRTIGDAESEVREAVDFCRYYAARARADFAAPARLPGPSGEANRLGLHGRGVFACISPWNFPLAIFTGQVAAALAAGNCVLAKPAEETPFVAAEAVAHFHAAGVPRDALAFLPGRGESVGARLVAEPRIAGVAFTGSTETARAINRALAARDGPIVPFIAETGGLNAMLVDSTAVPEQVVDDVVRSAFLSAGQRCSSLRVLMVQEEIANDLLALLGGAMDALVLCDPRACDSDIGPIIDAAARGRLEAHIIRMQESGHRVRAARIGVPDQGHFFAPHLVEIDRLSEIGGEVFGPILHVRRIRAEGFAAAVDELNALGFGLTFGLQSRIGAAVEEALAGVRAGNAYVNRHMVGAAVGSQPFGGEGLSGTGPKAGGPHYLTRFAVERVLSENLMALGGSRDLLALGDE
ncbi:MAG: bifunctional proline dehydrogenase/L-glutamate gamma-semialdehyde dehydrogenase PutA [Alphaproteobacteria bacterium]|nr:bifunctional proline dehydrogenase/L-glutamate gamma-semialdehyde dehydrogenase PutA [Alphaproteobacteria bacterium]